jgi:A/G-specific adenine glycosylase
MEFSQRLIQWYQEHKRDLPWRHTSNPYLIWLSEVILQQTRVAQGLPYYHQFVQTFPTVRDLAAASQQQVLKLWQGLGYYSRARNLHTAAMQVVDNGGVFPDNYKDLLQLKGVGEYTAAAIASFAYNEPVAVIDGNVYRVLSRIYGIDTAINETAGIKQFKKLAGQLLDQDHPANHNQAIMEFGALQCVPVNPACDVCPFKTDCIAFKTGQISRLPVKIKKAKVKNLFHHYLVTITPAGKTLLAQRPQTGIWAGLFEFPYIEASGALMPHELTSHAKFDNVYGGLRFRESVYNQQPILHVLSHRKIHAYFWIIEVEQEMEDAITIAHAFEKPVHVLIQKFMQDYWR